MGKKAPAAKVFTDLAKDYAHDAMSWVHHAQWMGPVDVPQAHIDMTGSDQRFGRTEADIQHFKDKIADKGKTKPAVLVKTPSNAQLKIVDGHARTLAYTDLGLPVRAFVGVVTSDNGPWDDMHNKQELPPPDDGGTAPMPGGGGGTYPGDPGGAGSGTSASGKHTRRKAAAAAWKAAAR